ncbi:hypothetical protein NP233_g11066 [Leucocoprinus birnbaumii]|uniref:Uncharacterized protein n=1 Tax=Leucocoprinus birnbaumii TaxID=56174 RepID=A0AAD5YPA3_9AGAR|nr:hypothetical protein NP233_g11066 [Leucocoprinus birnbaumii]
MAKDLERDLVKYEVLSLLLIIHPFLSPPFLLAVLLSMGHKGKNGEPALSERQLYVLKGLANEALAARNDIGDWSSPHATLRDWVKVVAIPRFNTLHDTPASEYEERKNASGNSSLDRVKSVQALVAQKHHSEIHTAAKASHNGTGPFVVHWNNALSTKVAEIPENERDDLQKMVEAEELRRSSPTKATIIAEQDNFKGRVSQCVRDLLGWEHRQFGDAACFLAVTYRDKNNTIQEFRCMISNQPQSLKFYEPFVTHYDQEMGGELAMVSGRAMRSTAFHLLTSSRTVF